jgi:3-hydroxybutyryl-CoA dehydrogenase
VKGETVGGAHSSVFRVAVIGAGPAGRAFAFRCAAAGLEVVLEDVMPEKLRRAQDEYGDAPAGVIRYVTTVEDAVREADLVIDFVPDELESKLEIFSMIDRMAPPRTVLCTPTNVLSITDLASCTYRAERCVGVRGDLHAREVELLQSRFLSVEVQETLVKFFATCGMSARFVADKEEPMLVKNAR